MDPKLKAFVAKKKPNEIINSILDLGSYYVVSLTKPNLSKDEFMLDNLYKIDKTLSSIKEFSIIDDREKYLQALKKPVYVLKR